MIPYFTVSSFIGGFLFSMALCIVFAVSFALGFGEPNVIPEAGETYVGWWAIVFFGTWAAGLGAGIILDALAYVGSKLKGE